MIESFWDKRFPTFLGILILGISLVGLTYVTAKPQLFELGARESLQFEDVRVSNQGGTSLGISFRTSREAAVQLRFGQTLTNQPPLFDDRDEIGQKTQIYRTHHFTVSELSPSTQYLFAMLSQGKVFDNEGAEFSAKTAAREVTGTTPGNIEPVKGTVSTQSGSEAKDALVYVKIANAALVSTIIKSDGSFLIPLEKLYTEDLTGFYTFRGDEIVVIEILGNDESTTFVKVPLGKHTNLPPITLGENLDFTAQVPTPTSLSSKKQVSGPESSGFTENEPGGTNEQKKEQVIVSPKEGDFLLDPKPLIRGSGSPSQKIEITVESEPQTAQLIIDESGEWSYQPDKALPPGKHTVLVRFFDGDTITKVIRQEFEVLASGSQVVESATPSPTMILSPTPSSHITPVPTAQAMPNTATVFPIVSIIGVGVLLSVIGFLFLIQPL